MDERRPCVSITLRHLEIFRAIMTAGGITEAARMLNTSQPTVSRELARMEDVIHVRLFERVKGRLRPTVHALQLFEEVQRSYYGLDRITQKAMSLRQFEFGQISILCLPVFSQSLLPGTCKKFSERFPNINIQIAQQETPLLEEWLTAQHYDLGLTEVTTAPRGTEITALMTLDEVCVLPKGHRLLAKAILSPEDFEGQPFVSMAATDSYRRQIDSIFSKTGITRKMLVETHSAASICAMVREGIGLAIVNPLTALDYIGNGVHIRPFSVSIPFSINIVTPAYRPPSSLLKIFKDCLSEQAEMIGRKLTNLHASALKN
jgi:DNA-binding transcriptional LysR family regulator